jgi:predicted ArsR family transcriptional regulator
LPGDQRAQGIWHKIDGSGSTGKLEKSLRTIKDDSNAMGFASSHSKEERENNSFCIQSRNCILYKVASTRQDLICHGVYDKIIAKSLEYINSCVKVELKECMALGDGYCLHVVRSSRSK